MKKIAELVKEAHQNAVNKGWWEEPRTYGELIALVHSEVSEALEDYRTPGIKPSDVWYERTLAPGVVAKRVKQKEATDKPCGIPSELADICIRIFDIAGKYGWGMRLEAEYQWINELEKREKWTALSFVGKLAVIHAELSKSLEEHDYNDDLGMAIDRLAAVLVEVEFIAKEYGIDLERAIAEKMQYNSTRPQRHGGKVL